MKDSDNDNTSSSTGVAIPLPCDIETHPWEPFVPANARVLIMGTFPPGRHRWSMDFYYPNRTNDFWYAMGLIFFSDKDALYNPKDRKFRLDDIRRLLTQRGIALHDTCHRIRRLKGNASDKYLEVIEPVDLASLLRRIPLCRDIATTGEKAATVIAELTGTVVPAIGTYVTTASDPSHPLPAGIPAGLRIWRLPSTSRAYPLPLASKAERYAALFHAAGIL